MTAFVDPVLRIPDTVREDVLAYRAKLKAFGDGDTTPVSFKAYRVPMGIYEQRIDGRFMVRVRLGAGIALPSQLERIADLSNAYGNRTLHFTTRQDVQIHDVALENTPDVLEGLLEAGLSSRGGGGNTVRNVSACPRSGNCPTERFDVAPYAIATAEFLLQHRSSFNLPRKYKIAFSGCGEDCGQASVADLGFFAQLRDGERGFSVLAGGGLGMNPRGGIRIEEFIRPEQILEVAEAVRRLFDKHGDRSNKHKARLRYVLNRLGDEGFKDAYREELAAVRASGFDGDIPLPRDLAGRFKPQSAICGDGGSITLKDEHLLLAEVDSGRVTIRLPLPLGDIPADDMLVVARIAEQYGRRIVRTTQLQELLIPGIDRNAWPEIRSLLARIAIFEDIRKPRPRIVACAGASTCKLGLCQSRKLAAALAAHIDGLELPSAANAPVIRISGCPNSCGGHVVGAIGLEGRAERRNGRLLPAYVVLAGGKLSEEGARLAEPLGSVPAKKIPELLGKALVHDATGVDALQNLVTAYGQLPKELPEDYYFDFGDDKPFSLAGRGPGECGVGVFDVVQVDIREAASAIEEAERATGPERARHLYRGVLAGARSLLIVFGLELNKDREIFEAFDRELITPGWVRGDTRDLVAAALDWKIDGDEAALVARLGAARQLAARVAELFGSLDANLKFRVEPFAPEDATTAPQDEVAARVDLAGVGCPINFVKAKVALEKIPVGGLLEVLLDEGEPVQNVPASFAEQGQEVLGVEVFEGRYLLRVRRKK